MSTNQSCFAASPSGRPHLGNVEVVEGLVSQFAREVMDIRHVFRAGRPSADKPVPAIEALAKHYGDIFLGADARYAPAPGNTRSRMGAVFRYLAPASEVAARPGEPGTAFFIYVAQIVTAAAIGLERGRPEAEVGPELQRALQSVVDRILSAATASG